MLTAVAYLASLFLVGFALGALGMTVWMSGGGPRGGHPMTALLESRT